MKKISFEKNNSWGSHSRCSYPNNKMVPKSQLKDLSPTAKKVTKKQHIKKIRVEKIPEE